MSIIPGIETAAPERTETSSGSAGSPKRLPVRSSSRRTCSAISSSSPSGRSRASQVGAAGVGRDREPGRDGQPHQRHLREPDPLAAEQLAPAVGRLVEVVDVASPATPRLYRRSARASGSASDSRTAFRRRARNSASHASERSPNQNGVNRHVEDDQRDAEDHVPDRPAPGGHGRLRLQRSPEPALDFTAAPVSPRSSPTPSSSRRRLRHRRRLRPRAGARTGGCLPDGRLASAAAGARSSGSDVFSVELGDRRAVRAGC